MPKKTGSRYTEEFKAEAIQLARSSPEKSIRQLAYELGIADQSLRNWIKQAEIDRGERIVGAVFALFVVAAINATLLPLDVPGEPVIGWFFVTLAFVEGFSERFAVDVITSTEQAVGGTTSIAQRSSPLLSEGGREQTTSSKISAAVNGETEDTSNKPNQEQDASTEPNK